MAYKVLVLTVFIFFIACSPKDDPKHGVAEKQQAPKSFTKKNLSYENQLAELYNIFRIAQSAAVPQETMDSVLPNITDKRLSLTKDFVVEYTKRTPDFINDKYLAKPDIETLKATYFLYTIGVDAFTHGAADPVGVINKGIGDMSDLDLLVNYYKVLFLRMHRMTGVHDYSDYSFDFDRLSLDTPEEKVILYYTSMSYFGAKYNQLVRRSCEKANAYAVNMPKYLGDDFYNYQMPAYTSFDVIYDQLKARVSIEKAFGQPLEVALSNYKKCN